MNLNVGAVPRGGSAPSDRDGTKRVEGGFDFLDASASDIGWNVPLTVRLHPMTTQAHEEVVRHICAEITATETVFPGTDLRLIYQISGSC
jgi:hypothetical protein